MQTLEKELHQLRIEFKKDFSIKELTNFKIGGVVDFFINAKSLEELQFLVFLLKKHRKEFLVLGSMTNVLFSDGKINKCIIQLTGKFNEIKIHSSNLVYVGSAVNNEYLLHTLSNTNLGGLEFMAGIPGTVGGAIYMNAGAFGKYIGDYVSSVFFLTETGEIQELKNCSFSYRKSIFQDNKGIIIGANINVKSVEKQRSVSEMNNIIEKRHKKHPWRANCAGSFFKNGKNYSAGNLIEKAGLKGVKIGGAQVSDMHANFIINDGTATYDDVKKLASYVKKEIFEKFNILLEEEVISII